MREGEKKKIAKENKKKKRANWVKNDSLRKRRRVEISNIHFDTHGYCLNTCQRMEQRKYQ